jgi:hypothetical protein
VLCRDAIRFGEISARPAAHLMGLSAKPPGDFAEGHHAPGPFPERLFVRKFEPDPFLFPMNPRQSCPFKGP